MHKIFLINMPFASLPMPSIGLTQLKAVVDEKLGDQVSVEVAYINQDFVRYMGQIKHVRRINDSLESHTSGIGDWFFSRSAFPEQPDNTDVYIKRYYPHRDPATREFLEFVKEKRNGLDAFLDSQIEKYGMADALIVGFTSMFSQTAACLAMAKRLKRINPNIITVMGGANCEAPMGKEISKHVEQIDYVFSGPALKGFPQFVQHCVNQERDKCETISGIFTKRNSRPSLPLVQIGQQQCGPVGEYGEELDINTKIKLDYASFIETYFKNFPNGKHRLTLPFETSRGCWWGAKSHCTFCGLNGNSMAYRAMSPELALEQFSELFKYAPDALIYQCVDNILPRNYIAEVLPYVNTPEKAYIFYEVKADLREEDMRVLAKAKVTEIQPGIEAMATSTLKLMKKGTTAFHNLYLLKNCVTYKIRPAWNLLVGFPGETKEVYEKYVRDMPLMAHLYPPTGVHPVRFDRYSPYFNKAKEYGLDLAPMEFYSYIYPFGKESLRDLAYYFVDTNISAEYSTTMIRWLGKMREKFENWAARWNGDEQSRPQLYFKQESDETVIYDSRFDKPVEHRLHDTALQVLRVTEKAQTVVGIARELAHIPDLDAEKEVARLLELGLLFQEANRYMSLVLPGPPNAALGLDA